MKLREQIFKIDEEGLFNCDVYYNEEITKGLYFTVEQKHIKRNLKNLGIKYQIPNTKEMLGVKYSKQYKFVIVTIVMLDDNKGKHDFQFIIKESCSIESMYANKHIMLEGFREILVSGFQMLYANTMADAITWADEHKE